MIGIVFTLLHTCNTTKTTIPSKCQDNVQVNTMRIDIVLTFWWFGDVFLSIGVQ